MSTKVNKTVSEENLEKSEEQIVKSKSDEIDLKNTEYYKTLISHEIDNQLAERLSQLIFDNKLSIEEFDENTYNSIKNIENIDEGLNILKEFEQINEEKIKDNKINYLCDLLHKNNKNSNGISSTTSNGESSSYNQSPIKGRTNKSSNQDNSFYTKSNDEKIKEILARTGYNLEITSGQRKYGGPPPDWDGSSPPPGCEIFIGNVPNYLFEDELIVLFEQCGKIWDLRLMVNSQTGFNKGYCFITYCNKEDAEAAQAKYDGYEIKNGVHIKVNLSVPNLRLFVGNIPKNKSKEEIFQEFSKFTPGLQEVILYSSPDDRKRNRGFCFLEYDSHKSASSAKRRLSLSRNKVWNCGILVDWADPQEEPDNDTMSRVKVLYVRNLIANVSEDQLREYFDKYGTIERVKKIKDYAFVHFAEREQALKAMEELNGSELKGVEIEVSLAKPPSDRKKKEEILRNRARRVMTMMKERIGIPAPTLARGGAVLSPLTPPMPPPAVVQLQQNKYRNNPTWWNAWYEFLQNPSPWWASCHDHQRLFSNGANQAPLPNTYVTAVAAAVSRNRTGNHNAMWQSNNVNPVNIGNGNNGHKWNKNKQNQYQKNNNTTKA